MFTYNGYTIHDAFIAIDASHAEPHEAVVAIKVRNNEGKEIDATPKELMQFVVENYDTLKEMCAALHQQWEEAGMPAASAPVTRH